MAKQIIEGFRLSPQQKYAWLLQQADQKGSYCAQCAVRIEGNLDRVRLKAAVQNVVNRHEILRTTFPRLPGMTAPLQVITDSGTPPIHEYNLSALDRAEQNARIDALFREARRGSFDVGEGPLLKVSLALLSPDKHVLLLSLPALCADAVTLKNLVQEIGRYYAVGLPDAELSPEPIQYADVSEILNELLAADGTEVGREYWRKQNISSGLSLRLPLENQPTGSSEFDPQMLSMPIHVGQVAPFEGLAQSYETSASVFLLACWQVLIWRLTAHSDIIVGTAYDGRSYPELGGAFGTLVRYLPVHCHLEGDPPFREVLKWVNQSARAAGEWQDCFTWEQLAGSDGEVRGESYIPVCFDFQEEPGKYSAADVTFSIYQQYVCTHRFKIKLSCVQRDDSLFGEISYDASSFREVAIQRWADRFQMLLRHAIDQPDTLISQLNILSAAERHQVVVEFNRTERDGPKASCIHYWFEEQVARMPEAPAAVCGSDWLSYAELNRRANQVAHYLRGLGVEPEVRVGLCMERSLEMIIGLLGILKAGGAYVPMDPTYPKERLAFILEDAQAPVLLTQRRLVENLPEPRARMVCLDTDWKDLARARSESPVCPMEASHLAYMIYTSGSTGRPKGVLITHQNLVHSTRARLTYYHEPVRCFLLLPSFAFDSSVAGIFWTLCQGGILLLPRESLQQDPQHLTELVARDRVSHLLCLPSLYTLLLGQARPQQLSSLTTVIVAGEPCPRELVTCHSERLAGTALFNEYGPTEGTVWSSVYDCSSQGLKTQVPIGRPISNTQIYLLDRHRQPVPIAVPGELYIGGAGLARGYLKRPELTAGRFIPNPFSKEPGARLYQTGDLGRYLPEGHIEFLGRIDQQVKIRGFRIELEEIETVLGQHPAVQEAVVITREDIPGDQRLVAYVIPHPGPALTVRALRHFLKEKLPAYMVPSAFVVLAAWPRTPNGKVNRRALPAPDGARPKLEEIFVAPRTPTEELLAQIWARVLQVERVGIHDHFLELGGHSLLATQLVSRVREAFQVEIPLKWFFIGAATVAELARKVELNRIEQTDAAEVAAALEDLDQLSNEEVKALLAAEGPFAHEA